MLFDEQPGSLLRVSRFQRVTGARPRPGYQLLGPPMEAPSRVRASGQSRTVFTCFASCEQFLQRSGTRKWRSFQQVAGFLERLSHADVAQQLEDGAFGVEHERTVGLFGSFAGLGTDRSVRNARARARVARRRRQNPMST